MSEGSEVLVLPRGPRRGDQVVVAIDHVDGRGRGVGVIDARIGPQGEPRRYTVEVRKTLPGERVRAILEGGKRRRLEAHVDAFLEPSPHRQEGRCRHFGFREELERGCGGCTLQCLPYERQLELKREHVARLLGDAGVEVAVGEVAPSPEPWLYRNKMELSFGDDPERRFAVGLRKTGWHNEVLPLRECFLMSTELVPLARAVGGWCVEHGLQPFKSRTNEGWLRQLTVREGKRTGQRLVELVTTGVEEVAGEPAAAVARRFGEWLKGEAGRSGIAVTSLYWTQHHAARGERTRMREHLLWGAPLLEEALRIPGGRELRFAIHPRAFFQPNTVGAEVLYAEVVAQTGLAAGAERVGRVVDLYCGTGTIALCLAPFADEVIGVELVPDAIATARDNARVNGVDNVRWHVGDVAEVLRDDAVREELRGADVVVVDPPRAGLSGKALEHLDAIGAPRVVYVSCNPQALARDIVALRERGYATTRVRPVDMFPQTQHVETVVTLVRERKTP